MEGSNPYKVCDLGILKILFLFAVVDTWKSHVILLDQAWRVLGYVVWAPSNWKQSSSIVVWLNSLTMAHAKWTYCKAHLLCSSSTFFMVLWCKLSDVFDYSRNHIYSNHIAIGWAAWTSYLSKHLLLLFQRVLSWAKPILRYFTPVQCKVL